jgi:hypothetical protein
VRPGTLRACTGIILPLLYILLLLLLLIYLFKNVSFLFIVHYVANVLQSV